MHSGFEIPGNQQHQQHHHQQAAENSCPPLVLSMNPTHILDHIHTTTQQQLLLDHHHFLQPHHHHHYAAAAVPSGPSSAYFPLLNFKLGLNDFKDTAAAANGGADALLRGSEHFELPEARQSSLGMLHTPFWAEVSNENSEIMNQRETTPRNCLDAKSRVQFSELDAIYKRLGNAETTQTAPTQQTLHLPVTPAHLPSAVTTTAAADSDYPNKKKTKKKKKKKKKTSYDDDDDDNEDDDQLQLATPMAEFFENLVNRVMDHQENLQKKFTEVMERLNEERREREEVWRSQEMAHFERESAARAHDKAVAKNREAMIVSYLEKITGQRINLPPFTTSAANTTDDSNCGGADDDDEEIPT